jgi:hypothetical protein
MSFKRFSNQTPEQVAAHLRSCLGEGNLNVDIDCFAGVATVRKAIGGQKGFSKKREKLKQRMGDMSQSERKQAMSAKRREKPKLKHVRNGRMITLKGYTGVPKTY